MVPGPSRRTRIARALDDASAEQKRADDAARTASRHEAAAVARPALAGHHESMARIHRRSDVRHRTTAELYREYARHLLRHGRSSAEFSIATVIGSLAGARSAVLILGSPGSRAVGVLASDDIARTAEEWEYVVGEGPAHDTATVGPVQAIGPQMPDRWPSFGPVVRDLGVRSVAAVPLHTLRSHVGSLVVFTRADESDQHVLTRLGAVGEAFLQVLVGDPDSVPATDFAGLVLAGVDHRPVVHQAAGIVAESLGRSTDDALAWLRARAFADGVALSALAARVTRGELQEMLRD